MCMGFMHVICQSALWMTNQRVAKELSNLGRVLTKTWACHGVLANHHKTGKGAQLLNCFLARQVRALEPSPLACGKDIRRPGDRSQDRGMSALALPDDWN